MVSCLMGDSTALASAIVRCCLKIIPRRARRTGPQALFVGSLAQKRSFFDKLQNILPV